MTLDEGEKKTKSKKSDLRKVFTHTVKIYKTVFCYFVVLQGGMHFFNVMQVNELGGWVLNFLMNYFYLQPLSI